MVHSIYPDVPLVFSNTGLEFFDIQKFARKMNAHFIRPKMNFSEVVTKYGYPIISKDVSGAIYGARRNKYTNGSRSSSNKLNLYDRTGTYQGCRRMVLLGELQENLTDGESRKSLYNKGKWYAAATELPYLIGNNCCTKMKKTPLHEYEKENGLYPIIGTFAEESVQRKDSWIRSGCNVYSGNHISCRPMSFWTTQDVLHYLKRYCLEYASPYGDICYKDKDGNDTYESFDFYDDLHCTGCQRTGCVFCCYGAHNKSDNRFLELKRIDQRQYEYMMGGGQWIDNPEYDPTAPEYDGEWKNWNPEKIWVPSKEGLGFKFVIDEFNKLYPNNKIKY